jgi:hypothetical protein
MVEVQEDGHAPVAGQFLFNPDRMVVSPFLTGAQVIASGAFPDHVLIRADTSGAVISTIEVPSPFDQNTVPHATDRAIMNRTAMAYSEPGIVLAYAAVARLDFFSRDGAYRGSTTGPRQVEQQLTFREGRVVWTNDLLAYSSITATPTAVYAMFCGCTNGRENRKPSLVHVFDWSGNFRGEYAIDRPVFTIHASDAGALVASYDEPFPGIGVWELPHPEGG